MIRAVYIIRASKSVQLRVAVLEHTLGLVAVDAVFVETGVFAVNELEEGVVVLLVLAGAAAIASGLLLLREFGWVELDVLGHV